MSTDRETTRVVRSWLEEGVTALPDRVLDAVLDQVPATPQRRALSVPWRFPLMPALTRATSIAAVALVAVVGAGSLIYLTSSSPGSIGSQSTLVPTAAPTAIPLPRGITGWKTYTSAVYGYTISYPDDWSVYAKATQKWQPGDPGDAPSYDVFLNPEADPNEIAFLAAEFAAPAGADLGSWDGLLAALAEMCAEPAGRLPADGGICQSEDLTDMCLVGVGCQPVAVVPGTNAQLALFGDAETGTVTYILMGRPDGFPAAAPYGGTVMLLKSILSQLGVREPLPGETPN